MSDFQEFYNKAMEIPSVREFFESERYELGSSITKKRNHCRLAQQQFAELMDIEYKTVCRLEGIDGGIDIELFKAANVKLDKLVCEYDRKRRIDDI